MKNITLTLLVVLMSINFSNGQSLEYVKIVKKSGETIHFQTVLRNYKKKNIFPDDNKDYIKGKIVPITGKKIKLLKSEIDSIKLNDGSKYIVLLDKSKGKDDYFIGFYVTLLGREYFKTYSYGHVGGAIGVGTSGFGYSPASINKIANVSYYKVNDNTFKKVKPKR